MNRCPPRYFLFALVITVFSTSLGCERPSTPPQPTENDPSSMRIVSLAPALTQMVVDLGLGQFLVAIAEYDMAAPTGLPVVGNYKDINTEALLVARPTHVLTMTGQDGPAPHLIQLASAHGFQLAAYPFPLSISQITRIIFDPQELAQKSHRQSAKSLGAVLRTPITALRVATHMNKRLARLGAATADATPKSVLMVIATRPIMASGPDTVHDQLLTFCGAYNAAQDATTGAVTFDKEMLIQANPDVILLLLPDTAPLQPVESDPRLAQLRSLEIIAVKHHRIVLINDPLAQLPSSSLPRIGAAMAKAIHPNLATTIDLAMQSDPQPSVNPNP